MQCPRNKALYEDGLIKFDWDGGHWQCDITAVRALSATCLWKALQYGLILPPRL